MRQHIVMNLPGDFVLLHSAVLDAWLDHAKPGDTLPIFCGEVPPSDAPFVSQTYVERHTAEVRARYSNGSLVIEPADAHAWQIIARQAPKVTAKIMDPRTGANVRIAA
jgi:hypothetical protein